MDLTEDKILLNCFLFVEDNKAINNTMVRGFSKLEIPN